MSLLLSCLRQWRPSSGAYSAVCVPVCFIYSRTQGGIFTTPGEAYTTPLEMWVKAFGTCRLFAGSNFSFSLSFVCNGPACTSVGICRLSSFGTHGPFFNLSIPIKYKSENGAVYDLLFYNYLSNRSRSRDTGSALGPLWSRTFGKILASTTIEQIKLYWRQADFIHLGLKFANSRFYTLTLSPML